MEVVHASLQIAPLHACPRWDDQEEDIGFCCLRQGRVDVVAGGKQGEGGEQGDTLMPLQQRCFGGSASQSERR